MHLYCFCDLLLSICFDYKYKKVLISNTVFLKGVKIYRSTRLSAHVMPNVQTMYTNLKVFYKTKTETFDVILNTRIENSSNCSRKIQ